MQGGPFEFDNSEPSVIRKADLKPPGGGGISVPE